MRLRCSLRALVWLAVLCAVPSGYAQEQAQPTAAVVNDYQKRLTELANNEMKAWAYNEVIVNAIKEQNVKHEDITITQERATERRYQQEKLKINSPFLKRILESQASNYLKTVQAKSDGLYTELIVVDAHGMNVGQSKMTSNYWQGEEPKWINTFQARAYAPYVSDVHFDDSTQMFQAEVSFMLIVDDQPIGIAYAGVDVEKLDEK